MSGIKNVLVRHSREDPPIVSEVVNSIVVNNDFDVKFAFKKEQTPIEASFVPSGFVLFSNCLLLDLNCVIYRDCLIGDLTFARFLARSFSTTLNGVNAYGASQVCTKKHIYYKIKYIYSKI